MGRICVRLNLERLRRRLSQEMMRELMSADVYTWLHDRGFILDGEWHCAEEQLGVLREDEIIQKIVTTTTDGVTYIDSMPYHR